MKFRPLSLRARLVLASVLVEGVMLSLLVFNSLRLTDEAFVRQAKTHLAELNVLFNASLGPALAQRDYSTLRDTLDEIRRDDSITYLVLSDTKNKVLATAGEPDTPHGAGFPSEPLMLGAMPAGGRFDLNVPISLGGQILGSLRYGLSTDFLYKARAELLRQSLGIAAMELLLSTVLLAAVGMWLTRHLSELNRASQAVASGHYETLVPVRRADEVGQLAGSFNRMTEAVRQRISQLEQTQQELRRTLEELSVSDATQRRFAQDARQERARLVSLLSAMNLGILFAGADGRVIYYNPAFLRIWMISQTGNLVGLPANEALAHSSNLLSRPDHFSRHILSVLETREVSDSFEVQMTDGRVVTQLNYPVRDSDGGFIGHLWIYEDVTHERQTASQLVYLAERDALTGLYNRHRFQHELQRMLTDASRSGGEGALLFFDLDEFKVINDNFGHRAGDALLIRVASEISALVRRNEVLTRLGGDEFALLVPNASQDDATRLAERVVRAVAAIPFRFEGQNLRLTSSLGIALYPAHATDMDELVAHADAAMYQAKHAGKNTWRIYSADHGNTQTMVQRLTWNDRITQALEGNLLQLHFQGIYHAATGKLAHLEALVRMVDSRDPTQLIMPGHFIPFAERSGKVLDIDRWVLAEAIGLLGRNPRMPDVAVNISGRSFDDPSLPQYIELLLRQNGVAPHRLQVELTETSAVSDLADAQRFIEALRTTGCGVALDDFGSGFSSFAYLKHLAVDTVKIDGLFVRNLPTDRNNQVFVKAIADVARGLGKRTVAEFVEDAPTLAVLREFGVDMVQGYHLDKPQRDHPGLAG
jgi:diguanylate cyclase (GGDEF)-like protein/PAS domain S-box-containing protein